MESESRSWVTEIFQYFKDLDIDAAVAVRNMHIPRKLYKYQRFKRKNEPSDQDRLLDVMQGVARFSRVGSFNDPYDCWISLGLMDDFTSRLAKELHETNQGKELSEKYGERNTTLLIKTLNEVMAESTSQAYNLINSKSRENMRILCLSETFDNILLWSHYATNHKGYCIEYEIDPQKHAFWPVWYRDGVFDFYELIESHNSYEKYRAKYIDSNNNLIPRDPTQAPVNDTNPFTPILSALVKASDWSYEREWRCTSLSTSNDDVFMPLPITGIYIGSETCKSGSDVDQDNIAQIMHYAKLLGFAVYHMEMDRVQFKLTCKKVYSRD